jgi:signal transduction histidine kinase
MMNINGKIKLLLVGDDSDNMLALESMLDSPECNIIKATSGNEALSLVRKHDFALVLLDDQMSGMNGFETAELMKGLEKTKNLPIILISAVSNDKKHIFKGYESGAVDYLFKPLDAKILKSKVQVFFDLYKQKRLLENQAFELEKRMTELSTVLLYLQGKEKLLKQQARELRKTNQELNDFAYIVSHDLKAPLRAIGSLASWIAADYADKLDEDGRERISLLMSRVRRMHDLIDGVLQYSRVGRIKEQAVEVDLTQVVKDVIDMIAPPKNITIDIENELPAIWCEPTRITQVIQNLLSNAIKYMDKPNGEIKIGCVEADGFWKFYVADNGPGIDAKYHTRIFNMFQTANPPDQVESTGIGLTLVRKIVEMYGGKIWVESTVGIGATFFFTLPKKDNPDVTNDRLEP